MIRVEFKNCTVIDMHRGTSQKGNDYAVLQLLTEDFQLFRLFFGGDAVNVVMGTPLHARVPRLVFELVPGYDGGVQLRPASDYLPSTGATLDAPSDWAYDSGCGE